MMKVVVLDALNISYVGCYRGGEWMMGSPNPSTGRTMDCLEGSMCPPDFDTNLVARRYDYCFCLRNWPKDSAKLPEESCNLGCHDVKLQCGGTSALSVYYTEGGLL